jgi:hypothetical protein
LLKNGLFSCSLRQLLRALLAWSLTALILLLLSALILSRTGTGSSSLGYLSSALSFLAALAAGLSAGGRKGNGFFLPALLTAGFLVLILLTAGSLLGSLNPSGVLSVVSFSFAGVFFGALLARGKHGRSAGRPFRGKRAFRAKTASR